MTRNDIAEILAIDTLVLIICAIKPSQVLIYTQIFAALAAGIYTLIKIIKAIQKK